MEIKGFYEYTKEEQHELLNHWWHYYGKIPYTKEEKEKFQKLVDEDIEFVRKGALIAYCGGVSSQDMINAWRNDVFDKYRLAVESVFSNDSAKQYEEELEAEFIKELVETYNNPEPDVPLTDDQIMEMIESIIGDNVKNCTIFTFNPNGFYVEDDENEEENERILTIQNVLSVYQDCLLRESEMYDNTPLVDFSIGEGVKQACVFNSERLALNKEKITSMVDCIADIENGPSFLSMCTDKDGALWTGDQETVDFLVQLGMACEVLEYPLPREMWEALPGSVPLVVRSHAKDNCELRTHKPKEFTKVVDEVKNDTYKNKGNVE